MSELYKEAIADAKKLKEIAEIDARNKIIEAVTPYIKKIIAKESADTSRFLFGEEDQPMDDPSMDPAMGGTVDGLPPEAEEPTVSPGDTSNAAPISPAGGLVGMPMPGDDGKITVDFQQLFSMGGGDAMASSPEGDLANAQNPMAPSPMAPPVAPPGAMAPAAGPIAPTPPISTGATPAGPEASAATLDPAAALGAQAGLGGQPPVGAGALPGEELPPEEELPGITGEGRITQFQGDVRLVAEKIDYLYFRGAVPTLVKESLKSKLFTLCEKLDEMVNEDIISSKKARLAENKLEFLFMKLNEAEQRTSYKETKGASMTTLREFAAKLFEEDALGPATADKATAHAEKVSGIAPGIDLFKEGEAAKTDEPELKEMTEALLGEDAPASSAFGDGKAEGDAENKTPAVHAPDALAKEKGAGIVESAPASTAFGDGVKATGAENTSDKVHTSDALVDEKGSNSILEFDEKELREAVAKLRKENIARKIASVKKEAALKGTDKDGHLKPPSVKTGDQGSAKPEGGKAPAQQELKECGDMGMEAASSMGAGSDLPGGDDMAPEMGAPGLDGGDNEVELTFQIDVDDLEALLSGATEDFVAEPSGEVAGDMGGSDDGGIELTDTDDAGGDDDDASVLLGGEGESEEDPAEAAMPAAAPAGVRESKKPAASKPLTEGAVVARAAAAVKSLKSQLSESKLLTAKALYVSKFAVREDLTSKQKQKIAEYFDKAKNLDEAKETYAKIKKILAESTTSNKLSGSASKPTATGSAKLNESTQASGDIISTQRWQLLAGIKSKK